MMNKDTVTWDRKTPGSADALGHPSFPSASGFPRENIRGNFQEKARRASSGQGGTSVQVDAVFFSESFTDGLVGDFVTSGAREYVVVNAPIRRALFASTPAFARYDLALTQAGSQQTAGV